MSATLRTQSTAAFLIAGLTMLTVAARAADLVGEPNPGVQSPATSSAVHGRGRDWHPHYYPWARSELVVGVRGASPLTVPFFGYNWYPGLVHYYGPPSGWYCCAREDAVVSVRY